jgi:hypothetical protein
MRMRLLFEKDENCEGEKIVHAGGKFKNSKL